MKPHARKMTLVVPTKIDGLRATWQYHCFAHRRTKDCTAHCMSYSTTTTRVQRKASKTVGCFQGMLPSQPLGKSTKSVHPIQILREYALHLTPPSNFLLPIFRAARANPDHPLLPEGPKTLSIRSTLQQPPPTVDTTSRSSNEVVSTVGGGCWSVERMDNVFGPSGSRG